MVEELEQQNLRIIDLMSQVERIDGDIRTSKQFIQREVLGMGGAAGGDDSGI